MKAVVTSPTAATVETCAGGENSASTALAEILDGNRPTISLIAVVTSPTAATVETCAGGENSASAEMLDGNQPTMSMIAVSNSLPNGGCTI